MKILFVSCAYPPHHRGGVAKLLTDLSVELIKRKHEVYVFSLMDDSTIKKYTIKNIEINGHKTRFVNIPASSLTDFYGRFRIQDYYNSDINPIFKAYTDEIKPDVIHFHAIQGLGANLITEAHNNAIPTILTMHDMWWFCPNLFMTDLNLKPCKQEKINLQQCINCLRDINRESRIKNFEVRSFLNNRNLYLRNVLENNVDTILTNSRTLKQYVQHNISCDILVNENGIAKKLEIIEKPVDPHKIIFGFVGGTSGLKGYSTLIEAFKSIKSPNWELHIYGVEKRGYQNLFNAFILSMKNRILCSQIIKFFMIGKIKFSSNSRIKYFPSYSDAEKYQTLNTLDIIIIPSIIRESFSLIAREGLILKKPIICSDCGGPEEIVENNLNGLIFKTNDTEDLRLKISVILKDPSLINKFKSNIDIHRIKSIEEQVNELESIFKLHKKLMSPI